MKIYLAGKISKNCWRHEIVDGLRYVISADSYTVHGCGDDPVNDGVWHESWPTLEQAIWGHHDYVGPFFTPSSHSESFHGDGSHGVGSSPQWQSSDEGLRSNHDNTLWLCLEAIDRADVVFAWIESFDCFGTFAELGYAKAKGIPIFIGTPTGFCEPDIWFPLSLAVSVTSARSANESLQLVMGKEFPLYLLQHNLPRDGQKTLFDEGDFLAEIEACGARLQIGSDGQMVVATPVESRDANEARTKNLKAYILAHRLEIIAYFQGRESREGDENASIGAVRAEVEAVIKDVIRMSERGSAQWRELLSYSVIKPLHKALSQESAQKHYEN